MEAFVTLVATDSYCPGALVLAHRLRDLNTTRPIVCLVTPEVSKNACLQLAKVCNVVHVNTLRSNDDANLQLLGRPELDITFTKLHAWRLTQYTKIVFLDADTLPLRNVDDLFDWPAFSAAPDAGWPDCFNSGVFVAEPSESVYSELVELASQRGSFDGGDQGLLNTYFSEWSTSPEHRLPFIYNTTPTAQYSYAPAHVQYRNSIAISHFIGQDKPWKWQMFSDGKVFPRGNAWPGLCELVQCWWDTWKKHYGETMPHQLCSSFLDPSSCILSSELQSKPIELFGTTLTNAWDTKRIKDDMQVYDERRHTAPLPPLHITLSTPSWLPEPVQVVPEPMSVPPEQTPTYGLPDVYHANEDSLPDLHAFKNEWDQPTHERSVWVAPRPPKPQVETLLGYDYSQYKFDEPDDNEDKDGGHGVGFNQDHNNHYHNNNTQHQYQDQERQNTQEGDHHYHQHQSHQDQSHQTQHHHNGYSNEEHVFPWETQNSASTSRSWVEETTRVDRSEVQLGEADSSKQMEDYMQAQMEKIVDDLEAAQPNELDIQQQNDSVHEHHQEPLDSAFEHHQERVVEEFEGLSPEANWRDHVDSTNPEKTTVDEYHHDHHQEEYHQNEESHHHHHQEEEKTSEWQGTLYAMDTVPSSPSVHKSPFASFISLETGDDDWSDRDLIPIPLKTSSRLFGDGLSSPANGTEDVISSRRNSLKRRLSTSSQKNLIIPKSPKVQKSPKLSKVSNIYSTGGYPDIQQQQQQSSRLFASGQTFYGKKTPYTSAAATPVAEKSFFIEDDDEDIADRNQHHGDFMPRNEYTLDFSLIMEMNRETGESREKEKVSSKDEGEDQDDEDEFDWDTAGALERLRNQSTSMLFAQVADAHAHSMNTLEMRDRRAGGTWDDTLSDIDTLVSGPVSPINDVLPDALYLSQRSVPPDLFSGHASPRTPVARNMAHNLTHEINMAKERYKAEQRASLSLVKPTMAAATLLEAELDLSKSRLFKRRSKPEFDLDLDQPSISPVWHAKSHDGEEDIVEHHAEDTFAAYFDEDTIREAQMKFMDLKSTADKQSSFTTYKKEDEEVIGSSVFFNQSTEQFHNQTADKNQVWGSISALTEPEQEQPTTVLVSEEITPITATTTTTSTTTTTKAWELPYSEVWNSSTASKQSALFEERMAALKQPLQETTTSTAFTSFGKPANKPLEVEGVQWKSDHSWVIEDMPGRSSTLSEEKKTVIDSLSRSGATNELRDAMVGEIQQEVPAESYSFDLHANKSSVFSTKDISGDGSKNSIKTTTSKVSRTVSKDDAPEKISKDSFVEGLDTSANTEESTVETIVTASTIVYESVISEDKDRDIKESAITHEDLEEEVLIKDSSFIKTSTKTSTRDGDEIRSTVEIQELDEGALKNLDIDSVLEPMPTKSIEVVWQQVTIEDSDEEEVELEKVEVDILDEEEEVHERHNEITEILLDEEESFNVSTEDSEYHTDGGAGGDSSTFVRGVYVDISEDYDSDGSQEELSEYSVEIPTDNISYDDEEFLEEIEQDVSELVILDEVPIDIVEGVWEELTEKTIEEEAHPSSVLQADTITQNISATSISEQDSSGSTSGPKAIRTTYTTTERSVSGGLVTTIHDVASEKEHLKESKDISFYEEKNSDDIESKVDTQDDLNVSEELNSLKTVSAVTGESSSEEVSLPGLKRSVTVTRTILVSENNAGLEKELTLPTETTTRTVYTTITRSPSSHTSSTSRVIVEPVSEKQDTENIQVIVSEESIPINLESETHTIAQTFTYSQEEPKLSTRHITRDSSISKTNEVSEEVELSDNFSGTLVGESSLESTQLLTANPLAESKEKNKEELKDTDNSDEDIFGGSVHVTHAEAKAPQPAQSSRSDKNDHSVSKSRSLYTKAWVVEPYQTEREDTEELSEESLFSSRMFGPEINDGGEEEEQDVGRRRTSIRSTGAVMDLLPPMESTLSRESVMSYDSMNSVVTAMLETQYIGQDSGSDYSSTRIINVPRTATSSQPEVVVEDQGDDDRAMQAAVDRSSRLHSRVSTSEDYESERLQTITPSSSRQSLGLPRMRQPSNSTRDGDGSEHSSYFEGSVVYLSANEYEPTDMMSVSSGVDSIDWHSATGSMDFVEVVAQDDDEDEAETDARVAQWVMEELEAPSIHRLERSTSRDHLLYRYFQRQQLGGGQTGGQTDPSAHTGFESVEVDIISQDSEDEEGSVGSDKTAT